MKLLSWTILMILVFAFSSYTSYSQTKIDSLENSLNKTAGIEERVYLLLEISDYYSELDPIKSITYSKEAYQLLKNNVHRVKFFRNFLIISSITIFILLILYMLSFRNKIKANKILQEQNKLIITKNQEIKLKTETLIKANKQLEKLNIAANQTDNAIIIASPQGDIEWINDGYTRLYGYTYDEYISEKGETYFRASSNPNIKEIFNKALSERKSQIYEADVKAKDGKIHRIHTTLTPVLNDKDEVIRLIAIDSDITKQKEIERELQKLLVTKDKFFSIIAHDLKNPFNSIIGLAQLLVHGYDRLSPEKIKYYHKNLYEISKNGYELLINLLEWSRSQMGTITFHPQKLNLFSLIEETISLYNGKAVQKEIILTNSVLKDSIVFADQNMLKTILRNLVSNALKFTERGGAIELVENNNKNFKEITVRDTGIGIAAEDLLKLFKLDESYTTEGTEDEMGTGLGLILCKEFIEKHGGEIWAESKVGFGSKFIFTLPLENKSPR